MNGRVGASGSRIFWARNSVVLRTSGDIVLWTCSRFMNRSTFSGSYDSAAFQFSRFCSSRDRWLAMVGGCAQFWVSACRLDMLGLRCHGGDMPLMCGRFFLRSGTCVDATISAIEADAGDGSFVHPSVVDVVN